MLLLPLGHEVPKLLLILQDCNVLLRVGLCPPRELFVQQEVVVDRPEQICQTVSAGLFRQLLHLFLLSESEGLAAVQQPDTVR